MRYEPGLAASPPSRDILKVEKARYLRSLVPLYPARQIRRNSQKTFTSGSSSP